MMGHWLRRMLRLRAALAGALLLGVLVAAGCGDDDGGEDAAGEGETTALTVGVLPIADVAPLYLGIEQGFFEEQGLEVEPRPVQGGAAVVTGVVSGDFEFGFSATEPLILGKAEGLPVKIVTTGNQAATSVEETWDGLMVQADGPIQEPSDLEGETIGVNAVEGTAQLTLLEVLEREGVDTTTLDFVELPFPDMPGALSGGRVAAVAAVEPFVGAIQQQGGELLVSFFAGLEPGMTIGTYFTLDRTIEEDPELVERFATAMNESLEYAEANQEEAREVIRTYTEIPPQAIEQMALPPWQSDLNTPTIDLMAELAQEHGFTEERVPTEELIWEGAEQ